MEAQKKDVREYIIDNISEFVGTDCDDLHNSMFNADYYIIGTYKAEQWCGGETFDIINAVKGYEQDNFGEVSTLLYDPEKVVNMYTYIIGEEILGEFCDILEGELTQEICNEVIRRLNES